MPRTAELKELGRVMDDRGGRRFPTGPRPAGRGPQRLALALGLVCGLAMAVPGRAAVDVEPGFATVGLLSTGGLKALSQWGIGGEGSLTVVDRERGLGFRLALGYQRFEGHSIPTGELIFNGTGTQDGRFVASQDLLWVAVGPTWSRSAGPGRLEAYLMGGRGLVRAYSSLGWASMGGLDPGSTGTTLVMLGVRWSPSKGPIELGGGFMASGGEVALWDDPPVIEDAGGVHVLQSERARLSGFVIRLGYCFGRRDAE